MSSSLRYIYLTLLLSVLCPFNTYAQEKTSQEDIEQLEKPLYNPFVERYVLDELKSLRVDLASTRHDLMQQILDREHKSVDRGVRYATDTVTYFFYLIAGATSILVLVGWTSIRDIKERMHSLAGAEIKRIVDEYEERLNNLEYQLLQKSRYIEENREEIELTQEVQSLWLRAQQENNPDNKILIYDQLLELRPDDGEALTYKADAVLDLGEPQWAASLCQKALEIDPENSMAYYQLACAYTAMDKIDEAMSFLLEAISRRESYLNDIKEDPLLKPLYEHEKFKKLIDQQES